MTMKESSRPITLPPSDMNAAYAAYNSLPFKIEGDEINPE